MKEGNMHLLWSRFRARVQAFTLRKRLIAILIAIAIMSISTLSLWLFNSQQGIWIGSLFFRKVSDNQYEASALSNPELNSYVIIELEQNNGYRVKWNGYEWYGIMTSDSFLDNQGKVIPIEQLPFWQKIPSISQDGLDYHKIYFHWKLLCMRTESFETLGHVDLSPYFILFALFIFTLSYLFPNAGHRLHGIIFGDYSEPLNEEERRQIQFSNFIGGILLVAFTVIYVTLTIISNWV